jgi:hypothetical protein
MIEEIMPKRKPAMLISFHTVLNLFGGVLILKSPNGQGHNARHHPPPSQIDLLDSRRVGGRVHAVVMRTGCQELLLF